MCIRDSFPGFTEVGVLSAAAAAVVRALFERLGLLSSSGTGGPRLDAPWGGGCVFPSDVADTVAPASRRKMSRKLKRLFDAPGQKVEALTRRVSSFPAIDGCASFFLLQLCCCHPSFEHLVECKRGAFLKIAHASDRSRSRVI